MTVTIEVAPPERLEIRTCYGCGAMGQLGGFDAGCREQRIELVRAAAFDEVADALARARACVDAFRPVVEQLATGRPSELGLPAGGYESTYRSVRDVARAVLHRHPRPADEDVVLDGAAESSIASWCADCGAVESFQPCMEVCIWRPVEWVSAASYRRARDRALDEIAIESRLRGLLTRLASVTPLDGEWRTCWRVLQSEARRVLEMIDPVVVAARYEYHVHEFASTN